jgi:superfamily II DNA or RNA helicase
MEAVSKVLAKLSKTKENAVVLKAPPSFGKSFILPYIVQKVNQKTLIIVDRVDLVKQMYKEFESNVEEGDFHIMNAKDREIRDINITTFQFLIRNPEVVEKLSEEIGFVVVDEAHVISIGAFTSVVNRLPAKYRLGLSATPTRSDGLTEALRDVMSDNLVEGDNPMLMGVKYLMVKLPFFFSTIGQHPAKAWARFYSQKDMLEYTLKFSKAMLKVGRAVLVYTTYSAVQKKVQVYLRANGVSAEIINQSTPKEEREEILRKFQEREIDVIISGTILQKGISIHRLDTVINLANHTKESLEQLVGRLRRDHPDKKSPILLDFFPDGAAFWKALDRDGVYKKLSKTHKKDTLVYWTKEKFDKFLEESL